MLFFSPPPSAPLYNYLNWQWERERKSAFNASFAIARLGYYRTKSLSDSFSLETNRRTFTASDLKAGGYIVMMQLWAKILKGKVQENLAEHTIIFNIISTLKWFVSMTSIFKRHKAVWNLTQRMWKIKQLFMNTC